MMKLAPVIVLLLLRIATAAIGDTAGGTKLNDSIKERALAFMKSSDAEKRKTAYRTFQHLGVRSLKDYSELLYQAQRFHQDSMRNTMRVRSNPYIQLTFAYEHLDEERVRVMTLIHTDWKKDSAKIKELEAEMQSLERKYKAVNKHAHATAPAAAVHPEDPCAEGGRRGLGVALAAAESTAESAKGENEQGQTSRHLAWS